MVPRTEARSPVARVDLRIFCRFVKCGHGHFDKVHGFIT